MERQTVLAVCGRIAREAQTVVKQEGWEVKLVVLNPRYCLWSEDLTRALHDKLSGLEQANARVILVYGMCAPDIDGLAEAYGARRVRAYHCYEMLAGDRFKEIVAETPGSYFLTPSLCRGFEALIVRELGLDQHPEAQAMLFKRYTQLVYLDTGIEDDLTSQAAAIAKRLDLKLRVEPVGLANLRGRLTEALQDSSEG